MEEKVMSQKIVLLGVNGEESHVKEVFTLTSKFERRNEQHEALPVTLFSKSKDGVPAVGQKFHVLKKSFGVDDSRHIAIGPALEVTEVVYGVCRDIIPEIVKDAYTDNFDEEGYSVKTVIVEPEISVASV
jgi:hypothetical protein